VSGHGPRPLQREGWRTALGAGVAGIAVIGVVAVLGLPAFLFPTVEGATRGSLAWYLVLPGFLSDAPTPEACGIPRYAMTPIDGASPQTASVAFDTTAPRERIAAAYATLLASCVASDAQGVRFDCRDRRYHAVVFFRDPGEGCRRARVTFFSG